MKVYELAPLLLRVFICISGVCGFSAQRQGIFTLSLSLLIHSGYNICQMARPLGWQCITLVVRSKNRGYQDGESPILIVQYQRRLVERPVPMHLRVVV
jgi:hypothetical protein